MSSALSASAAGPNTIVRAASTWRKASFIWHFDFCRRVAVGVLRRAVLGERLARAADKLLDRVGQVDGVDVVVPALGSDSVGPEQHVGVREPGRRLKAV